MASRKIRAKADSLLSKEKGTVYKEPGGRVNICLVYPNTYHIGMSNLGFQGIYTLLNERNDVVCERAFLPDDEDMEEYGRTGAQVLSLESSRSLAKFDIVAFSASFENDFPNILRLLRMSKIPARSSERKEVHPLLIMGGACAFYNPEPVADFFDVCFIGEAEEMLPEFIDVFKSTQGRTGLLEKAISIEGIYAPGFYEIEYNGTISRRVPVAGAPRTIRRRFVRDISRRPLRPSITTPETEFSNMYLIEAMRGCPWGCRFCVAGSVYKPVRKKDIGTLTGEVRSAITASGRVGIIAPSLTDYPHAKDVFCIEGVDFSITSLRATPKSAELVGFLKGYKSVSIAPESGTERLRAVIDKRITEEDIIETSRLILSGGVETLRLYFMVGLPTENETDIEGLKSLVKKIRGESNKGGIVLTLSTFVPKPFTPFQWHPMEKIDVVKNRLKTIKKELMPIKGIKVFHDVPKYAYMQELFSRGDRRVSAALEKMASTEDWRNACADAGVEADFYIFRQRDFGELLPWDFIDNGISKEKLWAAYRNALSLEHNGHTS